MSLFALIVSIANTIADVREINMNEQSHRQIINSEIDKQIETLLPYGAGPVNDFRLRKSLDLIANIAFREGQSYALLSLLTVQDVAERLGISERRVRAIAAYRHRRFGVGWKVPGTRGTWLFRPSEIEGLTPGKRGRPSKS